MSQFRIKNGLIIDNGGIAVTGSISSTAGITGSFSGSIAGFPTDVAAFSSSLSSRIASNEAKTGSYATTGSNQFNGSQTVTGSLTATGTIVAQTLVVQTITSSVEFVTGSNRFGTTTGNTHEFTGSVLVSGSHIVNGALESSSDGLGSEGGQLILRGATYRYNVDNYNGQALRLFREDDSTKANGTILMYISGSGNVGIGTASPGVKFHVVGGNTEILRLESSPVDASAGNGPIMAFQITQTNAQSAQLGLIQGMADGNWGGHLVFNTKPSNGTPNNSTTERMRITSAGYVGIGTTSPSYLFDVVKNTNAADPLINVSNPHSGIYSRAMYRFFSDTAGGQVGVVSSTWTADPVIAANETYLYGNRGLILYTTSTYPMRFITADTERMRITSTGLVGIGTTSPFNFGGGSGMLDVRSQNTSAVAGVFVSNSDATARLTMYINSAATATIGTSTNHALQLVTQDIERMRITPYGSLLTWNTTEEVYDVNSGSSVKGYWTNQFSTPNGTTQKVLLGSTSTSGILGFAGINSSSKYIITAGIYGIMTSSTAGAETGDLVFYTKPSNGGMSSNERMRITSAGNVHIGPGFNASNHRIDRVVSQGNVVLVVSGYDGTTNDSAIFYGANNYGVNGAATVLLVTQNSSTSRSISAGGTINASGSDYAEYITKAIEDIIAKGDIVGINSDAKLTNIFADAISFAVKSTDPSYVGGDAWFNNEKRPQKTDDQTEEEFDAIISEFESRLEIERSKVDRIAFSGQVPCNITGANVGDYIIPIALENGKIGGQAVSNPTFEQYQISVGKVWKIMEDGRAWVAVKIG